MKNALEDANSIFPEKEREDAIAQVAWNALYDAPDLAERAILDLPSGNSDRESLIQIHAQNLAKQNPEAALAWVSAFGTREDKELVEGQVSLVLNQSDPKRGLELLPGAGFTPDGAGPATERLLQNWTSKNPDDALQWLSKLPVKKARNSGFKVVFDKWIQEEPDAALRWAAGQGDRELREAAVVGVAYAMDTRVEAARQDFLKKANSNFRKEIEEKMAMIVSEREAMLKEAGESLPANEGHE